MQQNQKTVSAQNCNLLLTDHRHDVKRRLEGLVSNAGLAGHNASEADHVTGNDKTLLGIPLGLLPIRMELSI